MKGYIEGFVIIVMGLIFINGCSQGARTNSSNLEITNKVAITAKDCPLSGFDKIIGTIKGVWLPYSNNSPYLNVALIEYSNCVFRISAKEALKKGLVGHKRIHRKKEIVEIKLNGAQFDPKATSPDTLRPCIYFVDEIDYIN